MLALVNGGCGIGEKMGLRAGEVGVKAVLAECVWWM